MNFLWSPSPRKQSTKSPGKIRSQIRGEHSKILGPFRSAPLKCLGNFDQNWTRLSDFNRIPWNLAKYCLTPSLADPIYLEPIFWEGDATKHF